MSDLPLSGLTTLTVYSTTDQLEILDVSDTTFALTGTNKKTSLPNLLSLAGIPAGSSGQIQINGGSGVFGALAVPLGVSSGGTGLGTLTAHAVMLGEGTSTPGFATIGTAGNVLIDQGSGANPIFAAIPNATAMVSQLSTGAYNCTTSFANAGLSITLPAAGTYLIFGAVRGLVLCQSTAAGPYINLQTRLYDSTNSIVVPNSALFICQCVVTAANTNIAFEATSAIPFLLYSPAAPCVIQLQGMYTSTNYPTTVSLTQILNDSTGATSVGAIRIF